MAMVRSSTPLPVGNCFCTKALAVGPSTARMRTPLQGLGKIVLPSSRMPQNRSFRLFPIRASAGDGEDSLIEKWLKLLPDNKTALYSHSLPCIEAWLTNLGFRQSKDSRSVWLIERPDWHAQLSLDMTELYIRYLKSGPGVLERDIERKFSYALCREDLENAILGGP